jgi:endonuclease/exonuclease/phosphatase family metal-dependent hydrolase
MPERLRVLTWNLYHGRAVPPAGRALTREFADALASWDWDVALLQEVPPWWPPLLARAAGAQERAARTSRNLLLPMRRAIAVRDPDGIGSNGGGANAILVRGEIGEHRRRLLRLRPERRVVHAVSLKASGIWVANTHTSVRSADPQARDVDTALRAALGWAGAAPLVFGGDLNHRGLEDTGLPGMTHCAGDRIDYIFARGLAPVGRPELLDHGELSDHAPIAVTLATAQ